MGLRHRVAGLTRSGAATFVVRCRSRGDGLFDMPHPPPGRWRQRPADRTPPGWPGGSGENGREALLLTVFDGGFAQAVVC